MTHEKGCELLFTSLGAEIFSCQGHNETGLSLWSDALSIIVHSHTDLTPFEFTPHPLQFEAQLNQFPGQPHYNKVLKRSIDLFQVLECSGTTTYRLNDSISHDITLLFTQLFRNSLLGLTCEGAT
ncbi:hypothetical protein TSUD_262280 [Trifolium subterraneum]|nr:hypothetical protein TSUD_262280 [Trifolium subterraneum]